MALPYVRKTTSCVFVLKNVQAKIEFNGQASFFQATREKVE